MRLVGVVALTTVAIGCEMRRQALDTTAVDSTGDIASTTTADSAGASAGTAAAGTGASPLQVTLSEWSVVLGQTAVTPGYFTIHVMNQGTYDHALELSGGGREWKTEPIPPGGDAFLEVDLLAGTYEVYCPIEDPHGKHEQLGMRTSLVAR